MADLGSAFIDYHFRNADPGELERDVRKSAEKAEDDFEDVGKTVADDISAGMAKEFERHGPEFAQGIEKGLKRQKIKAKAEIEPEVDHNLIERAFERAATRILGPGGPVNFIGRGIADAFGAGFNVSGRSSLIAIIIPLVGFIANLIVGLIQAFGPLAALLASLPALLAAIGFQVGILVVAFQGVGTAIKGAFEAKNAKELNEALKNLTPSARTFVRSLLPLKAIFTDLRGMIQESFFESFGRSLDPLIKFIGSKDFRQGLNNLSNALGEFAGILVRVFGGPVFKKFVNETLKSTVEWLQRFGPDLVTFIEGLLALATAALPFLEDFGKQFGGNLSALGVFFKKVSEDPSFQEWLERMSTTLNLVINLFGVFIKFVAALIDTVDKAGGDKAIKALTENFERLTFLLQSDVGQKGIAGLISLFIFLTDAFFGLIMAIIVVAAALREFFAWVGTIPGWVIDRWNELKAWWNDLWSGFSRGPLKAIGNVVALAASVPGRIKAAIGNLGTLLLQSGRNLIEGLIRGIREKFAPLANIIGQAVDIAAKVWPFSPAEEGPFSGHGAPVNRGQALISGIVEGIRMEIPELRSASMEATSNIIFGANSIQANFNGQLPTNGQARSLGSALGTGLSAQIAARNTRLAVRTL